MSRRSKAAQAGLFKRYLEEVTGTRPWYAKISVPLHDALSAIAKKRGLTHVELTEIMARMLIERDGEDSPSTQTAEERGKK